MPPLGGGASFVFRGEKIGVTLVFDRLAVLIILILTVRNFLLAGRG
jgi:hypothetical protein